MNMKHQLLAVLALGTLAACSEYDPGLSDSVQNYTESDQKLLDTYSESFTKRYGEIDPDHTWGFGSVSAEAAGLKTRTVNVNRNMWDYAVKENNAIVGYTTFTNNDGEHMIVPGFPSVVDDLYYIEEGNTVKGYTEAELIAKGQDSYLPAGDVTDEEIQYVSEWFRTNPNPDSDVPEFTEFFVQDISQDYDRVSYPNGAAVSRSLPVYVGGSLGEDGWYEGGTLDNGTDAIVFGMDYFAVKTSEAGWEHENNFNAQKANHIDGTVPDNTTTFPNRTLKYWTTNGGYTVDFSYHNSDINADFDNYVLVHLTFNGPRTGKAYDGYYLAFDYKYKKLHAEDVRDGVTTYKYSQVKPDGYYSNWIVKLAPADPNWYKQQPNWHRIMCEDLGNTYDFDFNDLVFDVYYTGEAPAYTAHIRLQAAGGTLPIYIGFDGNKNYEAHELLGSSQKEDGTYDPINVGGKTAPYKDFTLTMTTDNPNDINIYVTPMNATSTHPTLLLPKSGEDVTLSAAPQKICIPGNQTRWLREKKQIEWGYKKFDEWVKNENGAFGFQGETPWNTTKAYIDESYLY